MKYFVFIDGCDYNVDGGSTYTTIEATDGKDIYKQLKAIPYLEISEIYYTEFSNVKSIDIKKMEKEIKNQESCKHNKVYANYMIMSNPPRHPWICSICGEQGADVENLNTDSKYDDLIKQFNKEEG